MRAGEQGVRDVGEEGRAEEDEEDVEEGRDDGG